MTCPTCDIHGICTTACIAHKIFPKIQTPSYKYDAHVFAFFKAKLGTKRALMKSLKDHKQRFTDDVDQFRYQNIRTLDRIRFAFDSNQKTLTHIAKSLQLTGTVTGDLVETVLIEAAR